VRELLVIRADGGPVMGTGHLMRCLALAQAWQDLLGGSAVFVSRVESDGLRQRIEGEGFPVVAPQGETMANEAEWLESFCRKKKPSWLALDGYRFDPDYRLRCRPDGVRLLVIDDLAEYPARGADLLVNQNIYAPDLDYGDNSARLLLGPRYCLLRREFRRSRPRPAGIGPVRKLLVTMGGADPGNATAFILSALHRLAPRELAVTVLVGPANPHRGAIEDLSTKLRYPCTVLLGTDRMDLLIQEADAAVSSAGTSLYEFLALGCPAAALVIAANQEMNARGFEEKGVARLLGTHPGVGEEELAERLGVFLEDDVARARMSEAGLRVVDGKGALRVAAEMAAGELSFRPATFADSDTLLAWANDPETRRNSFSTGRIGAEEHRRWLVARLEDPCSRIFIAETPGGIPVGVVRFDQEVGDVRVSVNLAPGWRGLGLAARVIRRAGSAYLAGRKPLPLVALIRQENHASRAAFSRAGFIEVGRELVKGVEAVRMVRDNRATTAPREDAGVCHC